MEAPRSAKPATVSEALFPFSFSQIEELMFRVKFFLALYYGVFVHPNRGTMILFSNSVD
jgi:hypothetical protein